MEQEAKEKEKDSNGQSAENSKYLDSMNNQKSALLLSTNHIIISYILISDVQTLDTMQALCLPLGASISLLIMFFFFDSMQMLFAICTASK